MRWRPAYTIVILSDQRGGSRSCTDSESAGHCRRPSPSRPPRHAKRSADWWWNRATAREVHHCALLLGYGAGVVNPYLAFETLDDMIRQRQLVGVAHEQAVIHYIHALNKGILKVMSKMGISTLQGYCGAQIFEAVGLERAFIDQYFTGTASRIARRRPRRRRRRGAAAPRARAFPTRGGGSPDLDNGGEYQWRRDGEYHLFNPETVFKLQHATRSDQYSVFKDYTRLVDDQNTRHATLRGLFELAPDGRSIPIDEVEPVERIMKRFRDRRDVLRIDQPGGARKRSPSP